MKRDALKKKPSKKVDWAAEVRKFKPQLNALTDSQRQRLLAEALADINGAELTRAHARRR
ncbi:MAG: hypothetical protein HY298_12665 [Verrucomicrobia bacterium]|nr:hypothetical protein [Verrucomicrobiota bacterium]